MGGCFERIDALSTIKLSRHAITIPVVVRPRLVFFQIRKSEKREIYTNPI